MRAAGSWREHAGAQAGERERAARAQRVAAHGAPWSRLGRRGRDLVPGGEDVEQLVVDHQQVDVGDRPGARDALLAPVERLARLVAAADHHQRAAALEAKKQLAARAGTPTARPRRARRADRRRARARSISVACGELGEALGREPREGRQRESCSAVARSGLSIPMLRTRARGCSAACAAGRCRRTPRSRAWSARSRRA